MIAPPSFEVAPELGEALLSATLKSVPALVLEYMPALTKKPKHWPRPAGHSLRAFVMVWKSVRPLNGLWP